MKLIVGNWKMNQTQAQVKAFLEALNSAAKKQEAWVAPQALHLSQALSLSKNVKIGAQNCSEHDSGAYTGENSPAALKDLGASFVLVGHSERRQLFSETNQSCAGKTSKALSHGLAVIYCVGETLAERESGDTLAVVKKQLREGLENVAWSGDQLIVAYEPVWAIGTGKVASPAQAQEVHAAIRSELSEMYGEAGKKVRLLYGGSVKPDNVQELMGQKDIDGALVGGASLKANDFLALCQ